MCENERNKREGEREQYALCADIIPLTLAHNMDPDYSLAGACSTTLCSHNKTSKNTPRRLQHTPPDALIRSHSRSPLTLHRTMRVYYRLHDTLRVRVSGLQASVAFKCHVYCGGKQSKVTCKGLGLLLEFKCQGCGRYPLCNRSHKNMQIHYLKRGGTVY